LVYYKKKNESNFGAYEENISTPKDAQGNKNSLYKGVKNKCPIYKESK